ncbi:TetR family transcriptional regulator [Clostridium chromiireducens]|uniref:TetR family transcriptional regulator n=1 Tax=Clostridium chromiireducens TaxID=225345 RepID=A0A964RKL6_9CLOT|nr:TetR family transcriptional regulator [Clostridium chromiireducens]
MEIKEKISRVALKLFVERGFFEVSISDLRIEMSIDKGDFCNYFKSKEQLVNETIDRLWAPYFKSIINAADECGESSKKKLFNIFQKYSEVESYLRDNFGVEKFDYRSIICLMIEGIKIYEQIPNRIVDLNNKLLEKIECVIEDGKRLGEVISTINSKSSAKQILSFLQSSVVLWGMNQNIDMKGLFKINFKHLWNRISVSKSNSKVIRN